MNQYVVGVLRDGEDGERFYRLDATTTEDALQLAFAMDGAYGPNDRSGTVQDETGTLALAKMYCRIIPVVCGTSCEHLVDFLQG